MAPEAGASLMAAWATGGALSFVVEAAARPRPRAPWRRPVHALAVHLSVWTAAHATLLALLARPWFAAALALAALLVVVLVGRAKFDALREPFVCQDFEYFTDALRHPRLYLPFLGWWRLLGAVLACAGAFWAGLVLEPPHFDGQASARASAVLGCFAVAAGALCAARAASARLDTSWVAQRDVRAWGLVASLWRYGSQARHLPTLAPPFAGLPLCLPARAEAVPDLVTVQSESFFDARESYACLRADLLPRYDALRAQALAHGRLTVPAWGANTIRTEFAFLTGLEEAELGVHRYQPYQRLAASGVATIASRLREAGYRTLCVHPYHGTFYGRDRLMPLLGFDQFIDGAAFAGAAREGAYVGDVALASLVTDLLRAERDRPLYVHVITMENHGPLHWERVTAEDRNDVAGVPLPQGCDELVAYARHLRHADSMLGMLADALAAQPRDSGLCFFGDHVPIMPAAYRLLGEPPGHTHYLAWSPRRPGGGAARDLRASALARDFLARMGMC